MRMTMSEWVKTPPDGTMKMKLQSFVSQALKAFSMAVFAVVKRPGY